MPLSPPPSSFGSCQSTQRKVRSQTSDEQRQNLLAINTSSIQKKCAIYLENDNIGLTSTDSELQNSQVFTALQNPLNQNVQLCSAPDRTYEMMQPLNVHQDVQDDIDPSFTCTSNISSMAPTFSSNIQDVTANTTREIYDFESSTVEGFTRDDANLATQGLEKAVDRMVHVIYKGQCRFDFVYNPNRQAKGW